MLQTRKLAFISLFVGLIPAFSDASPGVLVPRQGESPESSEQDSANLNRTGHLIKVDLPIDGRSASRVQLALKQLLQKSNGIVRAEDRPVVVLEFDTANDRTGQGSALGACIDLARFLTGSEMNRLKTIAFIPGSPESVETTGNRSESKRKLVGHAVLVALATDEIAMHPATSIGSAGIDEAAVDPFVKEAYRDVVSKRLTLPVPMAMAMLDKNRQLFRVRSDEGTDYVDETELKKMERAGIALETETLSQTGQLVEFSGEQLAALGLIRNLTNSRSDLARRLNLSADALRSERDSEKVFRAIRVELPEFIDESTLQWISRGLDSSMSGPQANMIILEIDSATGDIDASLSLARRLAAYDADEVRTVGFVVGEAKGAAGLLALSCQHLIMTNSATLGGSYESQVDEARLNDLKSAAAGIAESLDRDPAVIQAMLDPDLSVIRFRDKTTGRERLMTREQRDALDDADNWLPQGSLDFSEPLDANTAQTLSIARQVVSGFDELQTFYQLENEPQLLKPTDLDRWLHQAAMFLASPFVAPWLLFAAMFFLFNEVSQPGLGAPGFLGTLCLILYFWSQHLDGNANWLEILLFAAGALFVVIELFLLPGFGIFGIGGLLMIVTSIVLAAQTFVFPTTTEDLQQLPRSLFALVGAMGGTICAVVVLRSVLPNMPFFKKIMLEPPNADDDTERGIGSESLDDLRYLVGKKGETITSLVPGGKAKIGGQMVVVISEGRLIEKGEAIEVIQVAGNRVIVREA